MHRKRDADREVVLNLNQNRTELNHVLQVRTGPGDGQDHQVHTGQKRGQDHDLRVLTSRGDGQDHGLPGADQGHQGGDQGQEVEIDHAETGLARVMK